MTPLDKAIEAAGGVSKLASTLGLRQNVVSNWRGRGQVPAEHCIGVETATQGAVLRYELRPDVFGPAPADQAEAA